MKLSCTAIELSMAVAAAKKAISGRSSFPVLGCAYIVATDDGVHVEGQDLETGSIRARVAGAISDENGAAAVNATVLADALKRMAGDVVIDVRDGRMVSLSSGTGSYTLNGHDPEDWPMPKTPSDAPCVVTINGAELGAAIDRVAYAASTDQTRPILTGVHISTDGGSTITMAATDTYRLAEAQVRAARPVAPAGAIIPLRAMNGVRELLVGDDEVEIAIFERCAVVRMGDRLTVRAPLIEGEFPRYRKMVDAHNAAGHVVLSRDALVGALKQALIVARHDANRVVLSPGDGMDVRASATDIGDAHCSIGVLAAENPDACVIGFNARYLLDAIEHAGDRVRISCESPHNAALITDDGATAPVCMLSPMQMV